VAVWQVLRAGRVRWSSARAGLAAGSAPGQADAHSGCPQPWQRQRGVKGGVGACL